MTLAPLREPLMRSGLLPEASRLVLPAGIVSHAFPATERTCEQIGILFDPWQKALNRCILAKNAAGLHAADTVVLSIPRQVGKTFDIGGIVFADSIINPGTTTVWTAHRFKVARESFNEMRGWAKSPKLRQHIDYDEITTAAGNESIPFRNGSRILFAARERGAVRGFTKVARLVLDEAQILTEHAMSDLIPTLNQARNPQIVLMGTPPKPTDPGEVFTRLRTDALSGNTDDVLYVEMSAHPDADPDGWEAVEQANASYPLRTSARAILRMKKLLSPADFWREALGVWDEDAGGWLVIPRPAWDARRGADGRPNGPVVFGLSAAWPDAEMGSIAVAGRRNGEVWVQLVTAPDGTTDYRPGTSWMPARMRELQDEHHPAATMFDEADPVAREKAALLDAGVKLAKVTSTEAGQAFGMLISAVMGDSPYLRHYGQPELNKAVAGAQKRPLGDAHVWARKGPVDISPIVGVTHAVYGLATRAAMTPFVLLG